jgi:hypothetical protein
MQLFIPGETWTRKLNSGGQLIQKLCWLEDTALIPKRRFC